MVVRKSNFIERRPADTFVTHTRSRRARVRAPLVPLPILSSVRVLLVLQARCSAQDDRAETARQGGIRSLAF